MLNLISQSECDLHFWQQITSELIRLFVILQHVILQPTSNSSSVAAEWLKTFKQTTTSVWTKPGLDVSEVFKFDIITSYDKGNISFAGIRSG